METFDAIVVGAGVAGLRGAIELASAGARVAVVTKDDPDESSSSRAQGGIAVALSGEEHELVLHEEDTLHAGAGLCDPPAVSVLVREGRREVLRLIEWGARFDREGNRYHLTREAAHTQPRILHAGGDATGREIVRTLVARVRRETGILRVSSAIVTDLLVAGGRAAGVRMLGPGGEERDLRSSAVLLATGGLGRCYARTSNPPEATGDGIALALAAGGVLGDMEFVQFHPTALAVPGAPAFLLSEALRGEGGVIRNEAGERFLLREDPRGELAPRDVVARGIAREVTRQGGRPVFLDLTHFDGAFLEHRFPGILATCRGYGIDPVRRPIPVAPAAHYAMGGVVTDLHGRTAIPGLVAAGEIAATGVHGANRLASNSLLEGLVFGARAARSLLGDGLVGRDPAGGSAPPRRLPDPGEAEALAARLRAGADRDLGVLRRGDRLAAVLASLEETIDGFREGVRPTRLLVETASCATVLRAIARAALWREESRGAHFREDRPRRDDARFRVHSRQGPAGMLPSVPVAPEGGAGEGAPGEAPSPGGRAPGPSG